MATAARFLKDFLLGGVHCYRWLISPLYRSCCRFYPSCSHYAKEALEKHSLIYGLFLIAKRLLKCHPLHRGGIDHVP